MIVTLVLLAGIAAIGYIGYQSISGSDPTEPTPTPAAGTVPAPASPLLVPINEAQDVVDQINDNAVEDELIDELDILPAPGD